MDEVFFPQTTNAADPSEAGSTSRSSSATRPTRSGRTRRTTTTEPDLPDTRRSHQADLCGGLVGRSQAKPLRLIHPRLPLGERPHRESGCYRLCQQRLIYRYRFVDGFRKTLANEFASVYCFNLRGNQRTSGETSRREGGKVFGQGSRTPVAITLLVKNPEPRDLATIRYHDIGDYLTREEKLFTIEEFGSIESIPWQTICESRSKTAARNGRKRQQFGCVKLA